MGKAESRWYDPLPALVDSLSLYQKGATHEDSERLARDLEEKCSLLWQLSRSTATKSKASVGI